ncbi:sensor histidine kinase [Alkalicoccobacillus murimartini]|uniref:histidine kinase n=1 Tax=Alkalicoccobacillus murimartini TaxID=171685 RepID=A0ABT9YIL0_9BACI|nr:HAMP domain-containing sensor histidine kinase [Alkalicoccobacillus murimartini]MDQ0207662.1 signal transduction histidine kinase [Alkalicoccobacillus murimartini]
MRKHFGKTMSWSFLLGIAIIGVFLLLNTIGDAYEVMNSVDDFRMIAIFVIVSVGIIASVLLGTVYKFNMEWFKGGSLQKDYASIPLDVRFILLGINSFFILTFFLISGFGSYYFFLYIDIWFIISASLYIFSIWLALHQVVWLYFEIKDSTYLIKGLKDGVVLKTCHSLRDAFTNVSLAIKLILVLFILFMWGFGTTLLLISDGSVALLYIPCVLFIGIPTLLIFFLKLGYLNRVINQTEQVTKGSLGTPVLVKGHSFIATHATHINKLREGISHSVTEQAKSERLKTELITNVSHDLRTPLTSIITYTDLLKNPDLPSEERQSYVDVLARKSERLKTLIDDLFDVSKMASGQIELKKNNIELKQLIQQAIVEHQEAFDQEQLDLRLSLPEEELLVYVDGQKFWRMLDNLLLNAAKYAQPGTRVYLTASRHAGKVTVVIKNMSRYELSENPDELFERFKRADEARHTDGSGLGLAIAQSIAELHGGTLKLDIDGDLFKVTIQINNLKGPLST